jgi:hypothetical protein
LNVFVVRVITQLKLVTSRLLHQLAFFLFEIRNQLVNCLTANWQELLRYILGADFIHHLIDQ